MAVSQLDVTLEGGVDAVAALGSLQVDVRHFGVLAHRFPEHIALIVADVDAVNVAARVLALEEGIAFVNNCQGVLRLIVLRPGVRRE